MKDGVVIVNTARGAVMDEDALVKALESGKVRSCGLDVFEEEPKVHPGLIANPHVLLVPHMGTHTYEVSHKLPKTFIFLKFFHLTSLLNLRICISPDKWVFSDTNEDGSMEH